MNVDSRKHSGPLIETPRRGGRTSQRDVPSISDREISYKKALTWLYGLQRFGIKLGLENTRRLLDECCDGVRVKRPAVAPASPSTFKVIHVAGTNGKGSVCAMIDSICRAQGYRTGLFVSPHLVTFRERIRVNGEMIAEEAVAAGLTMIRDLVTDWDPHPTFFEVTTALALKHFGDAKTDIAILETGLGGRLDATNAVQSDVSVITPIALDHEKWLGHTLPEIAGEKAGIIKPGVPVVSAPQQPEAEEVIRARAAECDSPVQFVEETYKGSPVALRGEYQKQNAAVAMAAVHVVKRADCRSGRRLDGIRDAEDSDCVAIYCDPDGGLRLFLQTIYLSPELIRKRGTGISQEFLFAHKQAPAAEARRHAATGRGLKICYLVQSDLFLFRRFHNCASKRMLAMRFH